MSSKKNTDLNDLAESLANEVDSPEGLSAAVSKLQKLVLERGPSAKVGGIDVVAR